MSENEAFDTSIALLGECLERAADGENVFIPLDVFKKLPLEDEE